MKTIFLGNHTVGVTVLKVLLNTTDVVAVVANPDHPDDGILYQSVKQTALQHNIPVFQYTGKQRGEVLDLVKKYNPDLMVIADYKYLFPLEVLQFPPLGVINFHPSLLPLYRGRAPVNWAMINDEEECGLTVHFVDEGMDTGDIILQERIEIRDEDTIADIHEKYFPLYQRMAEDVIRLFKEERIPRIVQDYTRATAFPKRSPEDGLVIWAKSSRQVYNFVRAITYPYPGAFTFLNGQKYMIWACQLHPSNSERFQKYRVGQICAVESDGILVRTSDGVIKITHIEGPHHAIHQEVLSQFRVGQQYIDHE